MWQRLSYLNKAVYHIVSEIPIYCFLILIILSTCHLFNDKLENRKIYKSLFRNGFRNAGFIVRVQV